MAEEIVLDVKIQAAESANTVRELRKSLKALIDEQANVAAGSKEWKKLTAAINETEGKIGDLTDGYKTLTGSGVDRLNSSFGLLREGFSSFDGGKITTAFKGIGAAMKAIPALLIAEAIAYLVTNFTELSEGSGILAKVLRPIGDLFTWITDQIYAFTDAIGLTNTALEEQGEAIKKNAEQNQEALNSTIAAYDRQIKAAQASGKSTVELEKLKQQAIIDTNVAVAKQIEAFVRAGGELDDERKKLLTASLEAIKNAKVEEYVITEKSEQAKRAEYKKTSDERKKRMEDDWNAALAQSEAEEAQRIKFEEIDRKRAEKEAKEKLDALNKDYADRNKIKTEWDKIAAEQNAIIEAEAKAAAKKLADEKLYREENFIKASQGLSNALYTFQLLAAKGNAAAELEVKKKQFKVDKAFRVAQAIQDGIAATQASLASGGGVPFGIPFAIATGVISAANIANILASKFDGGSVSSAPTANISTPSVSTQTPTLNTTAPTTQASTTFDEQGRNQNFNRVYVVESDISKVQNRVARLQEQATI